MLGAVLLAQAGLLCWLEELLYAGNHEEVRRGWLLLALRCTPAQAPLQAALRSCPGNAAGWMLLGSPACRSPARCQSPFTHARIHR